MARSALLLRGNRAEMVSLLELYLFARLGPDQVRAEDIVTVRIQPEPTLGTPTEEGYGKPNTEGWRARHAGQTPFILVGLVRSDAGDCFPFNLIVVLVV